MLNVGTNTPQDVRESWYDLRELDMGSALVKAVLQVAEQLAELNKFLKTENLNVETRSSWEGGPR